MFQSPAPEWLESVVKGFLCLLVGGLLKFVYDVFVTRRKTVAEAGSINTQSNISTLQLSDELLRSWMSSADQAARELLQARERLLSAEGYLRESVRIMKAANVAECDAFEMKIDKILAGA